MQKFHFHVLLGTGALIRDEEGEARPSLADALVEAREIARELVGHEILRGLDPFDGEPAVIIEDANGDKVGEVFFSDAVSGRRQVDAG